MRNAVIKPSSARSVAAPAAVDYTRLKFDDFARLRPFRLSLVANRDELNCRIAREAVELIKAANARHQQLLMILPVGPIDYSYWSDLLNRENVSCERLVTMGMDEHLDASDRPVAVTHPLSFR